MIAIVTMAGMSVIHMLVSPTLLEPLQRSVRHKEHSSSTKPGPSSPKQNSISVENVPHERFTCLIPLSKLKKLPK